MPFQWNRRLLGKISASLAAVIIGVLAYTATLEKVVQHTPLRELDRRGNLYFNEAIQRALTTFAVVRGINGIISVIQGTDIHLSPAGIGVELAVGEILDPVNDLVERFSWVMLVSTTSLGIQKVLLEMGPWLGFKIILTLAMVLLLIALWTRDRLKINLVPLALKLLLLSLVLRFCIPAAALATETIYRGFLEKRYIESTRALDRIQEEVKSSAGMVAPHPSEDEESGYMTYLRQMVQDAQEALRIRERIIALKDKLASYARNTIELIIVFLLQTVFIPIGVLWVLIRLFAYTVTGNRAESLHVRLKDMLQPGSK